MSKGDGGGVSIVYGFHGQHATGEKRSKLKQATDLDAHLTQKPTRDAARRNPGAPPKPKVKKATKAERKAEMEARKRFKEAPKEVVVVHRRNGEILETRTVKRK